jgi:hypothetical protein
LRWWLETGKRGDLEMEKRGEAGSVASAKGAYAPGPGESIRGEPARG